MNIDYLQPLALHKLTTWLWHSAHLRKFWKIFSQFLILLDNHPRSLQIFGDLEMIFGNLHMILRTWKGMFQVIFLIIKFSASDNAILAFWLVHWISVTSHYTCVWPYMEMKVANVARHELFCVKRSFVDKKNGWKKAHLVSYLHRKYREL